LEFPKVNLIGFYNNNLTDKFHNNKKRRKRKISEALRAPKNWTSNRSSGQNFAFAYGKIKARIMAKP
jgi:hypothetical protein